MSKVKDGPPKDPDSFSSNWKKMQNVLPKKRKLELQPSSLLPKLRKEKKNDTAADAPLNSTTKNEIWFDVDDMLLEPNKKSSLELSDSITNATKALAMDCEMVGTGKDGTESVLARVSIVNQHGHCIYDKFVRPREKVTDFRTFVSGVRPHNLRDAEDFLAVQKEVADLLKGRILVGHAIHNDLKALFLDHPWHDIRDTQKFKPFRELFGGGKPSLKKLTAKVLGIDVQQGEHNSVEDAQAAMCMYKTYKKRWESSIRKRKKPPRQKKKSTKTSASSDKKKKVRFANVS